LKSKKSWGKKGRNFLCGERGNVNPSWEGKKKKGGQNMKKKDRQGKQGVFCPSLLSLGSSKKFTRGGPLFKGKTYPRQ